MYIISIRSERYPAGSAVFRGTLETVAGQRFEFSTLTELNGLLCEVGGWVDAPLLAGKGGEANADGRAIGAKGRDESSESDVLANPNFKEGKK